MFFISEKIFSSFSTWNFLPCNRCDAKGRCALFYAVETCNIAAVNHLLTRMNTLSDDVDGNSVLVAAITAGKSQIHCCARKWQWDCLNMRRVENRPSWQHSFVFICMSKSFQANRISWNKRHSVGSLFWLLRSVTVVGIFLFRTAHKGGQNASFFPQEKISLIVTIFPGDAAIADSLLQSRFSKQLIEARHKSGKTAVHYCAMLGKVISPSQKAWLVSRHWNF